MVKIFIIILICINLFSGNFNDSCVICHSKNAPELENLYFKYIQTYGSKTKTKEAMKNFLINPSFEKSVLPIGAFERFNIHPKQDTHDIDTIIDVYFETYSIKNRIKFY